MIKIRLARTGKPKKPFYRIISTDSHKKVNGGHLETLGYFHPAKMVIEIKKERLAFWKERGAKLSPAILSILK